MCKPNPLWVFRAGTLLFLVACVTARAAGPPYDYYGSHPKDLLFNVEKYHLQQGMEKERRGNFSGARGDYTFILHYFPNHPNALRLMSLLSLKTGNPGKAVPFLDEAIRLYPKRAGSYTAYGIFRHKNGDVDEAIRLYKKSLELAPRSAEVPYNIGLAYFEKKKYKQSNHYAQLAYARGYPLAGLQEKLQRVGAWKPEVTTAQQAVDSTPQSSPEFNSRE